MEYDNWIYACKIDDMPHNGGVCVKYESEQIALFYFTHRNEWYATQNKCPHKQQMAISRGMLGSHQGEPKVACPFHKRTFSLADGRCLNSEDCDSIKVYPVKVDDGKVYINITALKTTTQNAQYQDYENNF